MKPTPIDEHVIETADKPSSAKPKTNGSAALPTIRIVDGKVSETMAQMDAALNACRANIYQRSGQVVRAKRVTMPTWKKGESTSVQHLVPVDKETLVVMFEEACVLAKFNGRAKKWTAVSCPDRLADMFLKNARDLP